MKRAEAKQFWCAVIDWSDPENPVWLREPKCTIARDEEEARIQTAMLLPREKKAADIQVIVRPF